LRRGIQFIGNFLNIFSLEYGCLFLYNYDYYLSELSDIWYPLITNNKQLNTLRTWTTFLIPFSIIQKKYYKTDK
jgi:hypothetical protein